MRILLDEDLPRRLAEMLVGHEVSTVQRSGWTGIKNGNTWRGCGPAQMMLSNHGVDSDAHEAGARHRGRYAP